MVGRLGLLELLEGLEDVEGIEVVLFGLVFHLLFEAFHDIAPNDNSYNEIMRMADNK